LSLNLPETPKATRPVVGLIYLYLYPTPSTTRAIRSTRQEAPEEEKRKAKKYFDWKA
jgi:hypothetical protein